MRQELQCATRAGRRVTEAQASFPAAHVANQSEGHPSVIIDIASSTFKVYAAVAAAVTLSTWVWTKLDHNERCRRGVTAQLEWSAAAPVIHWYAGAARSQGGNEDAQAANSDTAGAVLHGTMYSLSS